MSRIIARRWWEKLAVLLAIASLWPVVLDWKHPFWRIAMYVMLGVMGVLFLANVVRLWRLGHPSAPHDDPQQHAKG